MFIIIAMTILPSQDQQILYRFVRSDRTAGIDYQNNPFLALIYY